VNKNTFRFYIETLGCPRNDSDSEAIITILKKNNFKIVNKPYDASHIIVNGCAFLSEAVLESIERILLLSEINSKATLLVVGCLAERYKKDLIEALPEVDILVGTGSIKEIVDAIKKNKSIFSSQKGFIGKNLYNSHHTTPSHYRYIKIQEGCNYECSFCIIPKIKGSFRSKPLEDIKEEIKNISKKVKEIILIGQDTSCWGQDIFGKPSLDHLLNEISSLFSGWIRILYLHPLTVSESLLETISRNNNIINYLDIPFQHVSSKVLKKMKRGYDRNFIEKLMKMIQSIDKFTLRTSFIVGYPEESENDFNKLYDFVKNTNIDHVGLFLYSHEEGTDSYSLGELDKKITEKRFKNLFSLTQRKMFECNKKLIGKNLDVLIDGKDKDEYYGRTKDDAPDIDKIIWIKDKKNLNIGNFYNVKITDTLTSELIGELQ
jgi:ribosomal protein S12 methylthiotransferase